MAKPQEIVAHIPLQDLWDYNKLGTEFLATRVRGEWSANVQGFQLSNPDELYYSEPHKPEEKRFARGHLFMSGTLVKFNNRKTTLESFKVALLPHSLQAKSAFDMVPHLIMCHAEIRTRKRSPSTLSM